MWQPFPPSRDGQATTLPSCAAPSATCPALQHNDVLEVERAGSRFDEESTGVAVRSGPPGDRKALLRFLRGERRHFPTEKHATDRYLTALQVRAASSHGVKYPRGLVLLRLHTVWISVGVTNYPIGARVRAGGAGRVVTVDGLP